MPVSVRWLARARPGQLNYSNVSSGGPNLLATVLTDATGAYLHTTLAPGATVDRERASVRWGRKVRSGIGIVPGMASEYSVVMDSPIFSFDCQTASCASAGAGSNVGAVERYWSFAKDTLAIAGRTALAPPFSNLFPSLDGKWRDFWSGGDEFGDDASVEVLTVFRGAVREVATEFGVRIAKWLGDGCMLVSVEPAQLVGAVCKLEELTHDLELPLELHAGILRLAH